MRVDQAAQHPAATVIPRGPSQASSAAAAIRAAAATSASVSAACKVKGRPAWIGAVVFYRIAPNSSSKA